MLKRWLDRVWTPGFAYDLTAEAWRGDINGRRGLLKHEKALIIQTTIWDERAFLAGRRSEAGQIAWANGDIRKGLDHGLVERE